MEEWSDRGNEVNEVNEGDDEGNDEGNEGEAYLYELSEAWRA